MSETKYVSDIQYVDHPAEAIYIYLSDFQNLAGYLTQDMLEQLAEKVPHLSISNFESDADSCRFSVGSLGTAELRIVEREPHKTIKVKGHGGVPVDLTLWIQLLWVNDVQTKLRLTLHTEMGMMVRMMVGDKLEAGINHLAAKLAGLPYR